MTYEFGDVVVAAGGTFTSKPRPVVIFQNSDYSTGLSTIVVPLTSEENSTIPYRIALLPTPANGLDRRCWLEIDKLGAIRTSWLGARLGELDSRTLSTAMDSAHRLISPGKVKHLG